MSSSASSFDAFELFDCEFLKGESVLLSTLKGKQAAVVEYVTSCKGEELWMLLIKNQIFPNEHEFSPFHSPYRYPADSGQHGARRVATRYRTSARCRRSSTTLCLWA